MEENKRTKLNPLQKKIEQGIRRTGFDGTFINAVKFHLEAIYSKVDASSIKSEYDYCNLLMSKLFIDKIDLYPTKRFKCQVNECSGWPIPILPAEVFGETKLSDVYRKKSFYKCLQVGDILDCRVASVLPAEYQLRVIHKYGATRILDDLNITVVMLRNESELFPCELIRVLVSEINEENEMKIHVTVNSETGGPGLYRPQLGRISEEHLPAYVLDPPELTSTYSVYLKKLLGFRNPILLNTILEGFGIDPRGNYSFFPTCESLKPVDGNQLVKESKLSDVKYFADLALQELEKGSAENALKYIQQAIAIYPLKNQTRNDKAELSKLYEIRGRVHAEMQKSKISKNALIDWGLSIKTDSSNDCGKKHLSRVIFLLSNKYYKMKDYKKAAEFVERACKLNKDNVEASALLDNLKLKHPQAFVNLDEESLLSLQEKKKELVTELKNVFNPSSSR